MPLPVAIPGIVAVALGALGRMLASRTGAILFMLGLSTVTFTGLSVGLGTLKADMVSHLGQLPSTMVTVMSLMRIDQGLLIIFSALAAKLALTAVNGAVTRWVMRPPQA
jgi:hypothetical protein